MPSHRTHLAALRFLLGLSTTGIHPSAAALLCATVPPETIGKALGLSQSVRALGMALGPLVGGYVSGMFAGTAGFRVPFLLMGLLMLTVPTIISRLADHRVKTPEA